MKDLFDVQIAIPEKGEQERIMSRLDTSETEIDDCKKQTGKLRSLKAAVMQDLLTGKKRVTPLLNSEPNC